MTLLTKHVSTWKFCSWEMMSEVSVLLGFGLMRSDKQHVEASESIIQACIFLELSVFVRRAVRIMLHKPPWPVVE